MITIVMGLGGGRLLRGHKHCYARWPSLILSGMSHLFMFVSRLRFQHAR